MDLQIYFSLYVQHCNVTEDLDNWDLKNPNIKNLYSSLNQYVNFQDTFKLQAFLIVQQEIETVDVSLHSHMSLTFLYQIWLNLINVVVKSLILKS